MLNFRLLLMLAISVAVGCAGRNWPLSSKWAMEDADYRAKYSTPYPAGAERYPRMAKQIIDARHVAGKSGVYLGGAAQDDPLALGGEIGLLHYPTSWLEGRVGLAGVLGAGADSEHAGQDAFGGLNLGLRAQTPTRIAPFVGVGLFGGGSRYDVSAEHDGLDNDDDLFVDERGETEEESGLFAAVYPEVGVHAWLSAHWRATGSASYYISTEGRAQDFWFYGLSLAWLYGADSGHPHNTSNVYVPPATSDATLRRLPTP